MGNSESELSYIHNENWNEDKTDLFKLDHRLTLLGDLTRRAITALALRAVTLTKQVN